MFKPYPSGPLGKGGVPAQMEGARSSLGLDETGLGFEEGVVASWMGVHMDKVGPLGHYLGPQEGL